MILKNETEIFALFAFTLLFEIKKKNLVNKINDDVEKRIILEKLIQMFLV